MEIETNFLDSLQAVLMHDEVTGITLARPGPPGKPVPRLEFLLPGSEGKSLVAGLRNVDDRKASA